MNFIDIIRRNLDGNAFRTMINEFTNNVIRSTDRTVEPLLIEKECADTDPAKTGRPHRSNRLLIFEDVQKLREADNEPSLQIGQVVEWFEFFRQQAEGNMHKLQALQRRQVQQPIEEAQSPSQQHTYVGPDTSQLQTVDPIYYMNSVEKKILSFELELSCSKAEFDQRKQQLGQNYQAVQNIEREIVSKNGRLLTQSLAHIAGIDDQVEATLYRIQTFRKEGMQAWAAYNKKAETIKSMAQYRKRLDSKLNFLRSFRRNTARIITSPQFSDESDWEGVVRLVQLATNNLRRLSNDQEMLITSRINCLKTFRENCERRLLSAGKWSITQFMKYLSSTTNEPNPVSFIAVWLYLQPFDSQVCAKSITTASMYLEQEFSHKIVCIQPTDSKRIIRGVLQPIARIINKLNVLQNNLNKPDTVDISIGKITVEAFRSQCEVLNQTCFPPSKQKFVQRILTLLSTKLPLVSSEIAQYLKVTLFPLLQRQSLTVESASLLNHLKETIKEC